MTFYERGKSGRAGGVMVLSALLLIASLSCGHRSVYTPDQPYWRDNDMQDIPEPRSTDPSLIWQTIDRTTFEQVDQLFDLERSFGKLSGSPREAYNINSFDEVPDCAWYTNRHGVSPMTAEEIMRGPAQNGGPDTTAAWTVIRAKIQGATPGFWIEDARGDRYILKFDPPGYPDLGTGAAAMASRFFYAMGYNVPQETIVFWRPENLIVKKGIRYTARDGTERAFTDEDLQEVLSEVNRLPDGRIRSLASLALPNVKGPFKFDGRRRDDPNDWCPHHHRRELRALYVFASFANHWDIKDQNTLDIYDEKDGRRFLRHYLIDFGSTFGSAGNRPQDPVHGYRNLFDLRDVFVSLFTLGLKKWQWEGIGEVINSSVGFYETDVFHPAKWDPIYPIPAFENMTDRDAYWAAKILMSFRDEHIQALIEAGQYGDPEAETLLFRLMTARRDKIGRYWFGKVNPLDKFVFEQTERGIVIDFEDLLYFYDLENRDQSSSPNYRCRVRHHGKTVIDDKVFVDTRLELTPPEIDQMVAHFPPDGDNLEDEDHLYQIEIKSRRDGDSWTGPVRLYLWYHPEKSRFQLVGIEHGD